MSERKYYCTCDSNCKFETMTKEQILAAIAQAVESGTVSDVDTGFITRIKEQNGGKPVSFWVGTTEQYNALERHVENCIYIKVDETTNFTDYIVERGVDEEGNSYDVKKYASGFAEGHFVLKVGSVKIDKELSGELYWSGITNAGIPFPVTLENAPRTCNMFVRGFEPADPSTCAVWLMQSGVPTADRTQRFAMVSNQSVYGADIHIGIHATWKWK